MPPPDSNSPLLAGSSPTPTFLLGGGEMGALIRAHDWNATPLGPPQTWPLLLRSMVGVMLNAIQPMYILWGPDLLCFYNDAYARSLGPERHPGSLGRPGREVWAEIWHIIGPQIDQVMSGGGGTSRENALVPMTRHGRREDAYWSYSYNPLYDATGICGVFVTCNETTDELRAAQRAGEERERFSALFEQAPTFLAMLKGPEHRFELANPGYYRLVEHRTLIGRTVAEALPEAAAQGFIDFLDRVYRTGQSYSAVGARWSVQPLHAGPTQERVLDFVYQPIKDAGGTVTGILVQGVDVTERVRTDAALRESEEQLRLATEAAEIGLWDVNVGSDELFWPPRVKAMFGISADKTVSMAGDFFPCLHPDDRERVARAYGAAVDPTQRALYDVEYRTVGKEDGVIRWVAAKGRALFSGDRCIRVIGTAIDITARKAAEAELRELNETLERRVAEAIAERKVFVDLVESTDARVMALDRHFAILAINRATAQDMRDLYGFWPKVGDNLLELLHRHPAQRDLQQRQWSRALSGEEFTVVDDFSDPAVEHRYFEVKFNTLRDRNGVLVGAFQFAHDVTDRLRDQARLAEAERTLRQSQKIDAIGQLTGGVAHDFNNLLMVISGGLSLLERPGDVQRRQRVLAQMRQAAERGASLSRQLLAFARRQPLHPEPVDLPRQIGGMRELLDRTIQGDIHVVTNFTADLWPVRVDPAELELVILNLCVNARDAMPGGGVITIGARNTPAVSDGALQGDFVTLTVADTGTGMSTEVMAHIFEPFYTTKDIGKGSGLGLPQVYGFARQSGGTVHVRSVPGRGTAITILLPRCQEPVREPTIDPETPRTVESLGARILLVEDDEAVAALVTDMLKELGYRVTRVASAQAALGALMDEDDVDLVLSDVMMPGSMNGMDLAREIRHRWPDMPVMLTTGYAGPVLQEAESAGIDLLVKPYELHALGAAVDAALTSAP